MFIISVVCTSLQLDWGTQGHCGTPFYHSVCFTEQSAQQGHATCPPTCQKSITPSALVHLHERNKLCHFNQDISYASAFNFSWGNRSFSFKTVQHLHCSLISHSPPEALYYWAAFNTIWNRYYSRAFASSSLVCFDLDIYSIRTDLPVKHNAS